MNPRGLPEGYEEIAGWLLRRIPWLSEYVGISVLDDHEISRLTDVVGGVLAGYVMRCLEREHSRASQCFFRKVLWRSLGVGSPQIEEEECRARLEDVFDLLEALSSSPNPDLQNFVVVSMYENLREEKHAPLKVFEKLERRFRDRLRPASRRLWDDWAPYVGEYDDVNQGRRSFLKRWQAR